MMKLMKVAGATSEIWQVFIADSSSTTGAGLTGLAFNTASLTAYYHRDTDTTATQINLVTMTVGTFTSSGFKEIDATNMPGWYQLCPPNAALASGAKSCAIHVKGATNTAPLAIEVQLTAVNPDSATAFVTSVASVVGAVGSVTGAVGSVTGAVGSVTGNVGGSVASVTARVTANTDQINGTAQTGRDLGASVLISSGTGTGQLDVTSGVIKANLAQILGTALTETAGQIAAAFKQFFNISSPTSTMNVVSRVTLADTVTTLTGNTVQTGDSFARIGAAGAGLTAIGDARMANLDAAVSSRSTFAGGAVASVTGNVGGNVTGSVGSVVGAVGSVTGAVGSVTGAVGSVTAAVALTTGERNSVADAILDRDMSTGTDSGSSTVRTTRQALRMLRNKVDTTTLTVYKEDDATASWTFALTTDAAAVPITVFNPAGGS